MKEWIEIWHTQKRTGRLLYVYKNDAGKKVVGHFKLKLQTSFWGQENMNNIYNSNQYYMLWCTCIHTPSVSPIMIYYIIVIKISTFF